MVFNNRSFKSKFLCDVEFVAVAQRLDYYSRIINSALLTFMHQLNLSFRFTTLTIICV